MDEGLQDGKAVACHLQAAVLALQKGVHELLQGYCHDSKFFQDPLHLCPEMTIYYMIPGRSVMHSCGRFALQRG